MEGHLVDTNLSSSWLKPLAALRRRSTGCSKVMPMDEKRRAWIAFWNFLKLKGVDIELFRLKAIENSVHVGYGGTNWLERRTPDISTAFGWSLASWGPAPSDFNSWARLSSEWDEINFSRKFDPYLKVGTINPETGHRIIAQ